MQYDMLVKKLIMYVTVTEALKRQVYHEFYFTFSILCTVLLAGLMFKDIDTTFFLIWWIL